MNNEQAFEQFYKLFYIKKISLDMQTIHNFRSIFDGFINAKVYFS